MRELMIVLYAMLAFVSCISCNNNDKTQTKSEPAAIIDSVKSEDGTTIHYRVEGDGEKAIVFVHGWSCDRSYWSQQVPAFKDEYTVVTVDLGGHGESGTSRKNWTMPLFGADVAAVVNALDLNDVILVGHSMGGAVIIEAARQLPGRVKALVGIDNFQDLGRVNSPEQIEQFLAGFKTDFITTTDLFVRGMFSSTADSALIEQVATDMSSAPKEVAVSAINEFLGYDFSAALAEVHLPVRCINSDKFPVNIEGNRMAVESFDVKIMPGSGHFLHMEDTATFNRLLIETLAELRRASMPQQEH